MLITRGMASPFMVTMGFGDGGGPVGGFRLGGHGFILHDPITSGGISFGSVDVPSTFLAALIELMRSNTLLTALVDERIYSVWPGAKADLPYVVVEDYVEGQPGEEIENNLYTVTIGVYADDSTVRLAGGLVQQAIDSPAMNRKSSRRRLVWLDGMETDSWRQPTLPPGKVGKTAFGADLYRWQLQYVFQFDPYFQQ